jgi:hypothetical protein
MNRYDERPPRFWRHERDRDEGFRESEYSGRTAGESGHQPFSENPYGYYPGSGPRPGPGRPRPERSGWSGNSESRSSGARSQPYGQREPYNTPGNARRSRWGGGPWNDDGSRYSESQYGTGGRRSRFDAYGGGSEPQFGEGPFADTSESPGYFGSGNYAEGGAHFTGGFEQRSRERNHGSLGEDTFNRSEPRERRYRTGPKGYTRSDERIREDISERLMMADSIDSSEVTVSVKEGHVTLEGTVPTRSMKHAIEDLADYTAGVQDVDNRIRVERPGSAPVAPTPAGTKTTKQ